MITDTGVVTCDCGERVRYMDMYSGGQAWTQWSDERGTYVNYCPGCGEDLVREGHSIKSDKPAFSPLAGYEPPKL